MKLIEIHEYSFNRVEITWHGLAKLLKTSRGEGWHIVNKGELRPLHRAGGLRLSPVHATRSSRASEAAPWTRSSVTWRRASSRS